MPLRLLESSQKPPAWSPSLSFEGFLGGHLVSPPVRELDGLCVFVCVCVVCPSIGKALCVFTLHTYKHPIVSSQSCEGRLSRQVEKLWVLLKFVAMGTAWKWLVPVLLGCALSCHTHVCRSLRGATSCLREKLGSLKHFLFTHVFGFSGPFWWPSL